MEKTVINTLPTAQKAAGQIRYDFIDNAKAIAIVLVVLGHGPALPISAKTFIYGFHIPLFYFLSGCLMSREKLQASCGHFLRYIGRSLVIPYVFFFLLSFTCWLVLKHFSPQRAFSDVSVFRAFLGVFTGTEESLVVNQVLWFLPCLMVISLTYYLLRKKFSEAVIAVFSLLLALPACFSLPHLSIRLPFGADCALVALAYYATGQLFRNYGFPMPTRSKELLAGFLILLALTIFLSHWNGLIDLSKLNFGRTPLAYLSCSYLGIAMTLLIAHAIPTTKAMRWLSSNTLVIFPLHPFMFAIFTGAMTIVLHLSKETKDSSTFFTLAYSVLAIGLAYPLSMILKLLFPYALGSTRSENI